MKVKLVKDSNSWVVLAAGMNQRRTLTLNEAVVSVQSKATHIYGMEGKGEPEEGHATNT